jgi:hypothetical protein
VKCRSRNQRSSAAPSPSGSVAVGVDIDHRFPALAVRLAPDQLDQAPGAVPPHCDHRMKQPVNVDAVIGERTRHGIDQEGHIVVHDRQTHPAPHAFATDRFDPQGGLALPPLHSGFAHERRRVGAGRFIEIVRFARKGSVGQRSGDQLLDRFVENPAFLGINEFRVHASAPRGGRHCGPPRS